MSFAWRTGAWRTGAWRGMTEEGGEVEALLAEDGSGQRRRLVRRRRYPGKVIPVEPAPVMATRAPPPENEDEVILSVVMRLLGD